MKIIDKEGRLLGKINLIDFLVIFLFLACFIPMSYYAYRIIKQQHIASHSTDAVEYIKIDINCLFIKLKPQIAKMMSVGDAEFDSNNNLIGKIVELGEIKPYGYKIDVENKHQKTIDSDKFMERLVTLRVKAEVIRNKFYYRGHEISYGSILEFVTDKYMVECIFITIQDGTMFKMQD